MKEVDGEAGVTVTPETFRITKLTTGSSLSVTPWVMSFAA